VEGVATSRAGPRISVLDADPELARWLTAGEVHAARRDTVVPVAVLGTGRWLPGPPPTCGWRHLGYLVFEGVVARDESLAGSTATELLGPGDLLQPWTEPAGEPLFPREVSWTVLETARLGVLGPAFVASTARWPALNTALLDRAVHQTARVATHHAICQLSPVDARLLALFWHLAERWGRVGAGSVLLPLNLQHETLGRLVGAKRPTVTIALQRLAERELVHRRPDGAWVLSGSPPEELRTAPAAATNGVPDPHPDARVRF
jgi:CRP/FNR family transcriptional regulator, cyclic AMP receptor protein